MSRSSRGQSSSSTDTILISVWVCVSYAMRIASAAPISRPVRNDSEVDRTLEWTTTTTDYFYANGGVIHRRAGNRTKRKVVNNRRRNPRLEHEAHDVRSDVSTLPPHPLGSGNPECPLELELLWSTRLGSSIYSAPLARRSMFADGGVQLVVPTFVRYLELIEGDEGLAPFGWPLAFDTEDHQHRASKDFDESEFFDDDDGNGSGGTYDGRVADTNTMRGYSDSNSYQKQEGEKAYYSGPALFHGSAAVHDVNGDGRDDICVADSDGNVYWVAVGEFGQYLHDYRISVPRLKVRRNWYEGLDGDFLESYIELSMFHHDEGASEVGAGEGYVAARERIGEDLYGSGSDDVSVTLNGGERRRRAKEADTLAAHASRSSDSSSDATLSGFWRKPAQRSGSKRFGHVGEATRRSLLTAAGEEEEEEEEERGIDREKARGYEMEQDYHRHHNHDHDHRREELVDYRGGFSRYAAAWLPRSERRGVEIEEHSEQEVTSEDRSQARRQWQNRGRRRLLGDVEELEGGVGEGAGSWNPNSMNFRDRGEGMMFGDDAEGGYGVDDDYYRANHQAGGGGKDDALGGVYLDDVQDLGARGAEAGAWRRANASEYVLVDAHVLTTPTVADINNDGHVEILLSVSYFFDRTKYGEGKPPPAPGVDPSKYVAGGVVCYDLQSHEWAWSVHLDLTTDEQHWRAYIFGAPTVADLDGDGRSEVIVGTSLGLLYVLDARSGFVLRGFPVQFGEIQSQVAVADVVTKDRSGDLEMLFSDMNGNLFCVDRSGAVLWDRQLAGGSSATPTIGDVDGDGALDVVVAVTTQSGASLMYAVKGEDGSDLNDKYPMRMASPGTQGSLTPPVLLVDLHELSAGLAEPPIPEKIRNITTATRSGVGGRSSGIKLRGQGQRGVAAAPMGGRGAGLHLVLPTYDGKLHVVEGATGCANHVDVGEHIYAMPIADDLQGDGMLDLVLGTMNGELMSFGTAVPYHPLNTWASMPNNGGRNGFTHGRHQGVFLYDISALSSGLGSGSFIDFRPASSSPLSKVPGLIGSSGSSGGSYGSSNTGVARLASNDVREVVGRYVTVTFEIVDKRPMDADMAAKLDRAAGRVPRNEESSDEEEQEGEAEAVKGGEKKRRRGDRSYDVSLSLGSSILDPLLTATFDAPGVYTVEFDLPTPMLANVVLLIVNEHGQSSTARFSISYNRHFFATLKWVATLPLLLAVISVLFTADKQEQRRSELPS